MDTPVVSFSKPDNSDVTAYFELTQDDVMVRGERTPNGIWSVSSPNRGDCPDCIGTADNITAAIELAMEYLRRA